MFHVIAITPALVTLLSLAVWGFSARKHCWVFGFAVLGCLIFAASPWFSMWFVWHVLNDHTANIGAGLLALGQPIIAPVGAVFGALFGIIVEAAVGRHRGR